MPWFGGQGEGGRVNSPGHGPIRVSALRLSTLSNPRRNSQLNGDVVQSLVQCPQFRSGSQPRRRKKVNIYVADAAPEQRGMVYEAQDLRIRGGAGSRKTRQHPQYEFALTQVAQSELADNEWMCQRCASFEQLRKGRVTVAEMLDPNRRIDQDHAPADRRLGGALRSGSVPPRRAKRRALSRSISALSASRIRLDFSLSPVNS